MMSINALCSQYLKTGHPEVVTISLMLHPEAAVTQSSVSIKDHSIRSAKTFPMLVFPEQR